MHPAPPSSLLQLGLCLWTGLALACSQAPSPPAPLAGRDCLVIVLDSLAASHLGCYGGQDTSPHIDALAARGVRFSRAWSQTAWTLPSTASLMTGLYQESHGVQERRHVLGERVRTLAEAFTEAGYESHAFSENPFASPLFGFGQGFHAFETFFGDPRRRGRRLLASAVLEALSPAPGRPPRFVYAHFRRPHAPYDPPDRLAERFADPAYAGPVRGHPDEQLRHNDGVVPLDPADIEQLRALYAGNIRAVDHQVGRILEGIDAERTLVVLLSDHGEAFAEHGLLGHNLTVYEEMVSIPFVVAHPALAAGATSDLPVMSIDVAPTLAELFGLDLDHERLQGRSLVPELLGRAGPARAAIHSSSQAGARQMLALFDGRWKSVRVPALGQEALYDLLADPGETEDLSARHPDEVRRLGRLWDEWWASQEVEPDVTTGSLTLDAAELFQALGYLGGPEQYDRSLEGARRPRKGH